MVVKHRSEIPQESIFRLATLDDVGLIEAIIRSAQTRLRRMGIDQWQNGYPNRERVELDVTLGYGRVLCVDRAIVAYGALTYDGEPAYDGLQGGVWLTSDSAYLTIHRLCVADSVVGGGYGRRFMQEAEQEAAQRVPSVRVDTHPHNLIMQGLISSLEYAYCGEVVYESPRLAYEKLLR